MCMLVNHLAVLEHAAAGPSCGSGGRRATGGAACAVRTCVRTSLASIRHVRLCGHWGWVGKPRRWLCSPGGTSERRGSRSCAAAFSCACAYTSMHQVIMELISWYLMMFYHFTSSIHLWALFTILEVLLLTTHLPCLECRYRCMC